MKIPLVLAVARSAEKLCQYMLFSFLVLCCGCSDQLDGTYESDYSGQFDSLITPSFSSGSGQISSEFQRQMQEQEKQLRNTTRKLSEQLSKMTKVRLHFSGNKVTFDYPGFRVTESYKIEDGNVLISNSPIQGRLEILSDGSLSLGPLVFRKVKDGFDSQTSGIIKSDWIKIALFWCVVLIVAAFISWLLLVYGRKYFTPRVSEQSCQLNPSIGTSIDKRIEWQGFRPELIAPKVAAPLVSHECLYYALVDNSSVGPFTKPILMTKLAEGSIPSTAQFRSSDTMNWLPISILLGPVTIKKCCGCGSFLRQADVLAFEANPEKFGNKMICTNCRRYMPELHRNL